jgi:hypothetical protein
VGAADGPACDSAEDGIRTESVSANSAAHSHDKVFGIESSLERKNPNRLQLAFAMPPGSFKPCAGIVFSLFWFPL